MTQVKELIAKILFMIAAAISVAAVVVICVFIFGNGVPAIAEIGVFDFLFGTTWRPSNEIFGIGTMIVGSLYVMAGALVIGVPLGILCAIFLANFGSNRVAKVAKAGVQLLAGIPSIVYGFFGLVVLVPFIRANLGGTGQSVLCASIVLGIMILPTIITLSESALKGRSADLLRGRACARGRPRAHVLCASSYLRPFRALWPQSSWQSVALLVKPWR